MTWGEKPTNDCTGTSGDTLHSHTNKEFLDTLTLESMTSAYGVWIEQGNEGSHEDFVEAMRGIDGTVDFENMSDSQKASLKGEQGIQGVQGDQGIQGTQGEKGDTGTQGIQGIQGIAGESFTVNEQGSLEDRNLFDSEQAPFSYLATDQTPALIFFKVSDANADWSEGTSFGQGAQGIQGIQGIQGEKGDTGTQGEQGIQGVQGDQGIQGVQGDSGRQGTQGIKGDTGEQGVQGDQGIQGVQGDSGRQGIQGEKGDTGEQGIQGIKGDTGEQGIQGIQGIQGEKGDTGEQGIQGEKGADGAINFDDLTDEQKSSLVLNKRSILTINNAIFRMGLKKSKMILIGVNDD